MQDNRLLLLENVIKYSPTQKHQGGIVHEQKGTIVLYR